MPKSDAYISFIVEKLKAGVVEWNKVHTVFCRKFPLSRKTFDKYWKIANEQHTATQQAINDKKAADYEQSQLNANKEAILSREVVIKKLEKDITDIEILINQGYLAKSVTINGKTELKKEVFGVYEIEKLHNIKDRKITALRSLEGWDKPSKVATTDKEGNDVQQVDYSKFTVEELEQLKKLHKKASV